MFLLQFICSSFCQFIGALWFYLGRVNEVWINYINVNVNLYSFLTYTKKEYFLRIQILNDICVVDW